MTKKIFAVVVAALMVMALSVSVFADISLLDSVSGTINEQTNIPLPEGLSLNDGDVVTVIAKGTSDNEMVRFYLTDAADAGRVTDVAQVTVEGGAFDVTLELVIDFNGGFGGTTSPTHLMFKGPDYATPPANVVFETLTIVTDGGDVSAPVADDITPEPDDAPAADPAPEVAPAPAPEAAPAPSTSTAPATGLALAVVPAVMALAAVAVSKKR